MIVKGNSQIIHYFCSIIFISLLILSYGRLQIANSANHDQRAALKTNIAGKLTDSNLKLELATNISRPTNIAFLDSGEVLVLGKKYRTSKEDCKRDRYTRSII